MLLDLIKANPTEIDDLDLTQKQKDSLLSGINQMDSFSEIVIKLAKYGINKKLLEIFIKPIMEILLKT